MNATHAYTLRGPSTKECPKTTPGTRYPHRSVLDTALPVLNSVARHAIGSVVKLVFYDMAAINGLIRAIAFLLCGIALLTIAVKRSSPEEVNATPSD